MADDGQMDLWGAEPKETKAAKRKKAPESGRRSELGKGGRQAKARPKPGAAAAKGPARRAGDTAAPSAKVKRDLFSMPGGDYELIQQVRLRLMKAGVAANKSEVVRAGLHALAGLSDTVLQKVFAKVERMKPGRKR